MRPQSPHFEKAGALFDSQTDALHAYATCLVKLKQLDKAAKVFERALALNPDDRRERQLLASIQLMAHQAPGRPGHAGAAASERQSRR